MPHEIDLTTGGAAVFAAGTPPWHGLGAVIEAAATSADAIRLARLDWRVELWPLEARGPDRASVVPDRLATVRTDTHAVLGVVSGQYRVFQNADAFEFMDSLVADKLAMYESAGALRGGRLVWMLARIPKEHHATPDDVVRPYVLLVNSHDGSTALRMIPTSVRVVCQNTLNLALRSAGHGEGIAIRHHQNLDDRVREARSRLGLVAARFDRFDEELHALIDKQLKVDEVESYFDSVLEEPDPQDEAAVLRRKATLERFRGNFDDPVNNLVGVGGTAWAAYNAVSSWSDHQRGVRGRDERVRRERRLDSNWFGVGQRLKAKAYEAALVLSRN